MEDDYSNGQEKKRPRIDDDQPLLKLLVPNHVAGSLIGKGGSVLTELQNKFGGRIRLSANKEFYPGTHERVVVVTGEPSQLVDINSHIMEIVSGNDEGSVHPHDTSRDNGRGQLVKIVLTNAAAGLLLGKGAETIRAINQESNAKLSLTQRGAETVPGERVLTISGNTDERTEACRLVIVKIAEDESNMRNNNVRYNNGNLIVCGGADINSGFNNQHSASMNTAPLGIDQYSNQYDESLLKTIVKIEMEVPNDLVTVLMGKGGRSITELVQVSGARFKFSDKDDFVPGTTNRKLTITCSSMKQAQTANNLVHQKVYSARGGNPMGI